MVARRDHYKHRRNISLKFVPGTKSRTRWNWSGVSSRRSSIFAGPVAELSIRISKRGAKAHWNHFWHTGGAIDLSGSKDPRWFELERRIVLSQYLTAIQDAGRISAAGNRADLQHLGRQVSSGNALVARGALRVVGPAAAAGKSLGYYQNILPRAEGTAQKQGYAGARWPKMTSPSGAESPSPVGPFLVWQEPHPIFYAELCWREHHDRATLEKYRDIVFQTADFMASYATWDTNTNRYVLGPMLQCAQEIFPKDNTFNPTFELTYWRWGLETAQQWRQRLGLPRDEKWDAVLKDLAKPPVGDGKYLFTETHAGLLHEPEMERRSSRR